MSVEATTSVGTTGGYYQQPSLEVRVDLSLLPEPEAAALDAMGQLYLLMSKDAKLGAASSKEKILSASAEKKEALEKFISELKKAAEDREDGGFWSKLGGALSKFAGIAGVLGAAALTVATCGAGGVALGLAISGLALSGAAMAQNECHFLEAIGVRSDVAGYLSVGLAVGGGLMTGGAGFLSSGAGAATTIGGVAAVAAGTSGVAAGCSNIVAAGYERSAAGHDINAFQAQQLQQQLQRQILTLIAALQETLESDEQNVGRIVNAIESNGIALEMASQGV